MNCWSFKIHLFVLVEAIIGFRTVCLAQEITGKDKYIFKADTLVIGPDTYNSEDCYYWEPKELLVDNTLPNPVARVSETTTFTVTITGKDFSYSKTDSMTVHYVKVEELTGIESYACQGASIALTAKLTDDLPLPEGWRIQWGGDPKFSNQNGTTVTATFGDPNEGAKLKACILGSTDTASISTLVVGFEVKERTPAEEYCDGSTVELLISPLPKNITDSYLGCFSDFTLSSETSMTSYGNPAGTTTLTFTPVHDGNRCEVENAIWYANETKLCNEVCGYRIWATAQTKDGNLVKTKTPLEIIVSTAGECVYGTSGCCENEFSGWPDYLTTEITPGNWKVIVTQGTFLKAVLSNPITIDMNPNSQFYPMTKFEEEYHSKQFEGLVPTECYNQTFIVDSILNNVNHLPITGTTKEIAEAVAFQYFVNYRDIEVQRSMNLLYSRQCLCARELDAKMHNGEMYNESWECTYKDYCNQP